MTCLSPHDRLIPLLQTQEQEGSSKKEAGEYLEYKKEAKKGRIFRVQEGKKEAGEYLE